MNRLFEVLGLLLVELRLVRRESREDQSEMREAVANLENELRDLKAELVAVGDLLVAAMPTGTNVTK